MLLCVCSAAFYCVFARSTRGTWPINGETRVLKMCEALIDAEVNIGLKGGSMMVEEWAPQIEYTKELV